MTDRNESKAAIVDFAPLIAWYQAQCNGDWEHRYGIKLETLDNPGWQLTVDLVQTDLQGRGMDDLVEGCSADGFPVSPHWLHCSVRGEQFRGGCDPGQVARLLAVFERFRASADRAQA